MPDQPAVEAPPLRFATGVASAKDSDVPGKVVLQVADQWVHLSSLMSVASARTLAAELIARADELEPLTPKLRAVSGYL